MALKGLILAPCLLQEIFFLLHHCKPCEVEMHCVISINQALAAKNECELAGENRINGLNTCEWPVNQQMYAGKVSQCSSIRLFYMVPGKDIGENSFINFYYFCIKGYQCLRLNLAKNSQNYTNNASQPCQALVIYWSSQTTPQCLRFSFQASHI